MANELMEVSYETVFGDVKLDANTVKQYLVRGNGKVSDQEVLLFVKMCQAQKLNPFVTGEVYLIKYSDSQPAQTVVGYDTYKRRAEENPSYLYKESGIVVCRGQSGEIIQKIGACLYPTETLVGGWCRVHKLKGEREVTTFKEVSLTEYDKGNAIWKEKPCTMIEKVAISQCLREAYPKDYEGLYTREELTPEQYNIVDIKEGDLTNNNLPKDVDEKITQSERKQLFAKVRNAFGEDKGNEILRQCLEEEGINSSANMPKSVYSRIDAKIDNLISDSAIDGVTEDDPYPYD